MGLKDKLTNFFKTAKNLFLDILGPDPNLENQKINKSKIEQIQFPKREPTVIVAHKVIETTIHPNNNSEYANSLNPHELYSPESTNSYFSNSDVFETKPSRTTIFGVDPSQVKIKESISAPPKSSSYNYTNPRENTSSSSNTYTINPKKDLKNNYFSESKAQKQESDLEAKNKKIFYPKPEPKPFCEYVVRNRNLSFQDSSLKIIMPNDEKQMLFLPSKNSATTNRNNYLRVEEGDFVVNLNYVNKSSSSKFSIAMYKGKETALTSKNFFVFRVKSEKLDKNFLELLIQNPKFDNKLAFLAFKFSKNNQISWDSFANNLFLNIPDLKIQENLLEKRKTIKKLIKVKQSICRELDEWMKNYFYSFATREHSMTKNFKELFSIDKKSSSTSPKLRDLKNQYGKFIFSSFKNLIIVGCESCNYGFCQADRLLLSSQVFGEETQKHILNLWIGCVNFSSHKLISLAPRKSLGIPYSYWLLRENLNNLVKNIPSVTSQRTVSLKDLRNCDFHIHSETQIKEFNKTCEPILEYQQSLEEQIYKLTKLKEGEIDISLLKTFSRKLSWDLTRYSFDSKTRTFSKVL